MLQSKMFSQLHLVFLFGIFLFGILNVSTAQAWFDKIPSGGAELNGYAWSDTIGWISFNCRTGGLTGGNICGSVNYNVRLDEDGNFYGYAWSDNIGWIKFGNLSNFPDNTAGIGMYDENAYIYGNYPDVYIKGWARACAGTVSGTCADMTSRTDGWDGWISFRGNASDATFSQYGVQMSAAGGTSNSFAWGGPVVGWISMDETDFYNNAIVYDLTVNGCTIRENESDCTVNLFWSIVNGTPQYYVKNATNYWESDISNAASGNASRQVSFGDTDFELGHNSGVLQTSSVNIGCAVDTAWNGTVCASTIIPTPTVTLKASKAIARTGDTVRLDWAISTADSCALTGPGMTSPVTGSSFQNSAPLRSKTRFTITCTGAFGTVSAAAQVEIIPVAKEV